jgi:hypothetical protein
MATKSTITDLQAVLDRLRSHRECECCGETVVCLGPDPNNRPYGLWVHEATQDKLCQYDDAEAHEARRR